MLNKVILSLAFCVAVALAQSQWAFQEDGSDDRLQQNAENKRPLTGKNTHCMSNEYLYPGDQADDYVCDCKPGYLYVPSKTSCYPAYFRNSCAPDHYLVLPKNAAVPKCERNPCASHGDGYVPYQNKCHKLNEVGPCQPALLGASLSVNEVTMDIECQVPGHLPAPPTLPPTTVMPGVFPNRIEIEDGEKTFVFPEKACFIGGRRTCA